MLNSQREKWVCSDKLVIRRAKLTPLATEDAAGTVREGSADWEPPNFLGPYRELNLIIRNLPRGSGEPALAATLPSRGISPSEWLAVAGSSIRAVASVVKGDVLHQATEDLGRCPCAGWLPHGGDLILVS
jgi:hypothetical protein